METYRPLVDKLRDALQRKKRVEALYVAMKRGRDNRAKTMQEYEDFQAFRMRTKEMKQNSITNLEPLLEEFTVKAREKGAHVFVAKGAGEAMNYVIDIAKRHGAKIVAKSKSLTTEEIRFNEPLEHAGYRVVETDLGERIIQIAGEKPFHLVFPAIHKTSEEVGE
ncbi:MAG: lactate utilization protein, partial [Thaumarchaeota archaeon]|nr:lactate utilization protein [Nitrososphaerota archaeon]